MDRQSELKIVVDRLEREGRIEKDEYKFLLSAMSNFAGGEPASNGSSASLLNYINGRARAVAQARFGTGIYIRGLIEVSNYCRNDCYYCGIRRSNGNVHRYRLSQQQILACCREGHVLGFRTFVLQGGEDGALSDSFVEQTVKAIRHEFPDSAITLSLGERSPESYRRLYEAGANRYLLRHETADSEHYGKLHPSQMLLAARMESLWALREIGFQTGTGMMIGSPWQTIDNLVDDIVFMERFRPQMIGLGPYIPQADTPLAGHPAGNSEMVLLLISIFRLMFPAALIPSTTALASATADGRERGILAGANVVMPNLSPPEFREWYAIYNNKKSFGSEAAEGVITLENQLTPIGYHISYDRGDYNQF